MKNKQLELWAEHVEGERMVEMVALSVQQPYASLIISGEKTVEYRTWYTKHRGPLLIVSSKNPMVEGLPCGMALGFVYLVECQEHDDGHHYEWQLNSATTIKPFPVKGKLGLYHVQVPAILIEESIQTMNYQCLTFGYQGKKLENLLAQVTELEAVVCDIRLMPYSRWQPSWNKKNLQATLGNAYHHIPQLGNLNYKNDGSIAIADMDTGIQILLDILSKQQPIILMCVCRNFETCHRSHVAAELERHGVKIGELELPIV